MVQRVVRKGAKGVHYRDPATGKRAFATEGQVIEVSEIAAEAYKDRLDVPTIAQPGVVAEAPKVVEPEKEKEDGEAQNAPEGQVEKGDAQQEAQEGKVAE